MQSWRESIAFASDSDQRWMFGSQQSDLYGGAICGALVLAPDSRNLHPHPNRNIGVRRVALPLAAVWSGEMLRRKPSKRRKIQPERARA